MFCYYNIRFSAYKAINNSDRQDAITNKWYPQPTVLVARRAFAINKCCQFTLTVSQVLVMLIVSIDASMQGAQGSNHTDEQKVVRRSTAFFLNFGGSTLPVWYFFQTFYFKFGFKTQSHSLHKVYSNLKANFAFTGALNNSNNDYLHVQLNFSTRRV